MHSDRLQHKLVAPTFVIFLFLNEAAKAASSCVELRAALTYKSKTERHSEVSPVRYLQVLAQI